MVIEKVKTSLGIKKQSVTDDEEAELIAIMEDLLKDNACFLKLNMGTALNMLSYIGYSRKEAKEVYICLMRESCQLLKGKYQVIDITVF